MEQVLDNNSFSGEQKGEDYPLRLRSKRGRRKNLSGLLDDENLSFVWGWLLWRKQKIASFCFITRRLIKNIMCLQRARAQGGQCPCGELPKLARSISISHKLHYSTNTTSCTYSYAPPQQQSTVYTLICKHMAEVLSPATRRVALLILLPPRTSSSNSSENNEGNSFQ